MKIAKGFTLSEILIAMLVLGIIVAASVPIILNLTPNKNVIMMKKAYYATENIVHSLINDPNAYPDQTMYCDEEGNDTNGGTCYQGLDDQNTPVFVPGVGKVEGTKKLRCLFASKLNIKEDLVDVCTGTLEAVNTMDGMTWYIGKLDLGDDELEIDVDGINKGVHAYHITPPSTPTSPKGLCPDTATMDLSNCSTTALTNRAKKNFDRIQIKISKDGRLSIEGDQKEFQKIISGEVKLMGDDDDK